MAGVIPAQAHLKGSQHSKAVRNHHQVREVTASRTSHLSSPMVLDNARYPTAEYRAPHDEVTAALMSGIVVATMDGPKKTLTCTVCRMACNGDVPMCQHLQGDAHMKNLQRRKEECTPGRIGTAGPDMKADGMSFGNCLQEAISQGIVIQADDGDPSHLKCVVCSVFCTGEEPMKQHMEGRPHQRKLRMQGMNPFSEDVVQTIPPRPCDPIERSDIGIRSLILDDKIESSPSLGGSTPMSTESTALSLRTSNEKDYLQEAMNTGVVVKADDGDSRHLKCVVCSSICTGEVSMKSHINGKAHQKKLRVRGMNIGQTRPQSSCYGASSTFSNGEKKTIPLSSRTFTGETPPPPENTLTCGPEVRNASGCSTFSHIRTTPQGRILPNSIPSNMQDVTVYLPSDSLADIFS